MEEHPGTALRRIGAEEKLSDLPTSGILNSSIVTIVRLALGLNGILPRFTIVDSPPMFGLKK